MTCLHGQMLQKWAKLVCSNATEARKPQATAKAEMCNDSLHLPNSVSLYCSQQDTGQGIGMFCSNRYATVTAGSDAPLSSDAADMSQTQMLTVKACIKSDHALQHLVKSLEFETVYEVGLDSVSVWMCHKCNSVLWNT